MRTVLLTAFGVGLMALALWHRPADADDFVPFYRAATLTSTGPTRGNVYANPTWSPKKNREDRFLPFLRIPSYALVLRPLAALPYPVARKIWIGLLVIALGACIPLFPGSRSGLAIGLAFSFAVADALIVGQDISFVLLIAVSTAWVFSSGHEFLAGMLASLLAIKLTYLPAAGIVFLVHSRRGVRGFLAGTAIQFALSFAVGGLGWPSEYLATLRNPLLDPEPRGMLNIHAVAASLSLPNVVYLTVAAALYLLFWLACRRLNAGDSLIVALALGLIASPHGLVYDGVVLVPLFVRVASTGSVTGWLAYFGLTPVIYLMVLMGNAPVMFAGSSLIVLTTAAAAIELYRRRQTPVGVLRPTVPQVA